MHSTLEMIFLSSLAFFAGAILTEWKAQKRLRWLKFFYLEMNREAEEKMRIAYEICLDLINDLAPRLPDGRLEVCDDPADLVCDDLRYWKDQWTRLTRDQMTRLRDKGVVFNSGDDLYPVS